MSRHGFTLGCPACFSAQLDDGIRRGGHTEECRLRFEELMPEQKERADQRIAHGGVDKEAGGDVPMEGAELARDGEQPEQDQEAVATADRREEDGQHRRAEEADADELEDRGVARSEMRLHTPERLPAVKRTLDMGMEQGNDALRRRYGTPSDADQMDLQDPVPLTPRQAWYENNDPLDVDTPPVNQATTDAEMHSLDEMEKRMLSSVVMGADITEVYSPERVNKLAEKFGLRKGNSLDLTNGRDFSKQEDRARAWRLIRISKPYIVIGSPPCTMFSRLQELNKHVHGDNPVWQRTFRHELEAATQHINFCMSIYKYQLNSGRHFLHGHPLGATSWGIESVRELLDDRRVTVVESYLCRFGMESHWESRNGEKGPVKKPTCFMTSAKCVADRLNKHCQCPGLHVHLGGGRAAAAQVYLQHYARLW